MKFLLLGACNGCASCSCFTQNIGLPYLAHDFMLAHKYTRIQIPESFHMSIVDLDEYHRREMRSDFAHHFIEDHERNRLMSIPV